jgi:pimeloyl-ACP methyl ester carboxylesterase
MRDYYDNRWSSVTIGQDNKGRVPTGIAVFDHQFIKEGSPPRKWAERLYEVHSWTQMPRGGHFAAVEEPLLLARDIASFFASQIVNK